MKIFIPFILSLLFLFSCRKSNNMGGHVQNYYTREPIAGLAVSVVNYNSGMFSDEGGGSTVETAYTDVDGYFSFDLAGKRNKGKNGNYKVVCSTYRAETGNNYEECYYGDITIEGLPTSGIVSSDKQQRMEFKLLTASRVKFLFNNPFSYSPGDTFSVAAFDSFYRRQILNYPGNWDNFASKHMYLPSNGKILLDCYSVYGGKTLRYVDTVFVKPFEKTEYIINRK